MNRIESPVFVIGCPRSGTTLLYRLLQMCSSLWSIGGEGHHIWEKYHAPSHKDWHSNTLGREDVTEESRRFIIEAFVAEAAPGVVWRCLDALPQGKWRLLPYARKSAHMVRVMGGTNKGIRLLEKTPKNCLRLPFLLEIFPDARILYLQRDGRSNISSIIEGWKHEEHFATYTVPLELHISGYSGQRWNFVLPPDWRTYINRPLEEVCAYQWIACNEAVLAEAPALERAGQLMVIKYEELVQNPVATLKTTTDFLGLPFERHIQAYDKHLPVVSKVSTPAPDKWKRQNAEAIERIMPLIRPTMEKMGYRS